MVDAADHEKLDGAKNELHSLLDKPQLSGIPVRSDMNIYPYQLCGNSGNSESKNTFVSFRGEFASNC